MDKETIKANLELAFGKQDEELEDMPDFEEETTETSKESESSDKAVESSANAQNKASKLSPYEQAILSEMERRAGEGDTLLSQALQSKDKTITECFQYVKEQARKKATNGCAMIEDAVVYGWAHHYYIEPKATIDKELHPATKKADTKAATATKKEDKKVIKPNPLLASLTKTFTDKNGSTTKVTTDKHGNKTTTIEKGGKTYQMTELSLF